VLLIGHLDTVWELGTLKTMPFRVTDGRASGPGTLDMKSGLTMLMLAIEALQERHGRVPRPVTVLLTSDEEVGSRSSRELIQRLAKNAAAALVVEPAAGLKGALKTSRKGVGGYRVKVRGVGAHAGLDFDKGHSAIVEAARQIQKISGFVDRKRGITVNPGVIRGGTRTNVVAAEAEIECDARIVRAADATVLEKRFRGLRPFDRKCALEVSGGIERPPMERTRQTAALFGIASGVARSLGFTLAEAAVGGGSDGNFTSAVGTATLDGLGGVGDGAHAAHEFVFVEELPRRAALLAGLVEAI
jgi:glutamate carboxypeptidase